MIHDSTPSCTIGNTTTTVDALVSDAAGELGAKVVVVESSPNVDDSVVVASGAIEFEMMLFVVITDSDVDRESSLVVNGSVTI